MTTHLDDTTWEQLAMNELAGDARAEALRHVMECPRCRTIHRGLRTLEIEARAEGLLPARKRRGWIAIVGVAAAAAAGVLLWWQLGRSPDEPVVRGGSATIDVIAPATVHAGERVTWTPAGGAYTIDVFAEDGTPAWHGTTAEPRLAFPRLSPGRYRVRIAGTGATSRLVAIEVVP